MRSEWRSRFLLVCQNSRRSKASVQRLDMSDAERACFAHRLDQTVKLRGFGPISLLQIRRCSCRTINTVEYDEGVIKESYSTSSRNSLER